MRTSIFVSVLALAAIANAADLDKLRQPIAPLNSAKAADVDGKSYDLVVVGGTAGGIACAVRGAREGLAVLLVNHTQHLGGFMTSGAGGWEAPYDGLRSPLYAEIRTAATEYYKTNYGEGSQQHLASIPSATSNAHIDRAKLEPRIAELLFNQMVEREPKLTVLLGYYPVDAERDGSLIKSVTLQKMHGNQRCMVNGRIFVDGMYEGDLAAVARTPCQIGRESRSEYDEPHAGVVYCAERHKEKGQKGFPMDASSGKLNIRYNSHATAERLPQSTGEADGSVMAYNYRLILTKDPTNRALVEKPANYDVKIARNMKAGGWVPNLPNGKIAWNGGRLIGPQNEYSAGDWVTRERISQQYLDAMLMLLWYLQNDPSAPDADRKKFAGYGLAKDEFPDSHHVPYEIYVREARRLRGRYVFIEQDNVVPDGLGRTPIHVDSVAITDWPVDSVACLNRTVKGGRVDGVIFLGEESRPAQVPYRSLLPQGVDNLLVPVALSASHVGWGSIRLEPVWMQTGEAAGYAAALALEHQTTPGKLGGDLLVKKLVANRTMVSFFNDEDVTSSDPWGPAAQYFGSHGFFHDYDARAKEPLKAATAKLWAAALVKLPTNDADANALARKIARAEQSEGSITEREFSAILPKTNAIPTSTTEQPITRGTALEWMWKMVSD